jgi:hypothetical protein
MLRSVKELEGYAIEAKDGRIGHVFDLYFDDQYWVTRYLVVETGGWLERDRVLISPLVLEKPNWETRTLTVDLTRKQVEESPSIDMARPVSRQQEAELHSYYGWRPYWRSSIPAVGNQAVRLGKLIGEVEEEMAEEASEQGENPHLRGTREVIGYHIRARDGEAGHVADLIVNDSSWVIHYLVIDTGNLWTGKKVLIAPVWVERVDWLQRMMRVDLLADTIRKSPEYDPSAPVNREYEARLYDYYGRPRYWDE